MRGTAPEHIRHRDTAIKRDVSTHSTPPISEAQHAPRTAAQCYTQRHIGTIERRVQIRASHSQTSLLLDSKFRTEPGHFERRRVELITH